MAVDSRDLPLLLPLPRRHNIHTAEETKPLTNAKRSEVEEVEEAEKKEAVDSRNYLPLPLLLPRHHHRHTHTEAEVAGKKEVAEVVQPSSDVFYILTTEEDDFSKREVEAGFLER